MDAFNYIIILLGFTLVVLLFFVEALLIADSNADEKDTFLWKTYAKNPRRFSLCCAIAVAIGVVLVTLPVLSFLFENNIVFGISAIVLLFLGVPGVASKTYHDYMSLNTSTN